MDEESTARRAEIATRLRMARKAAGLSQGQVAKKLNLHRPTISEIEAGRRRVSAEEVSALAQIYGIDANWIVHGSNQTDGGSDKIMLAARQLSKLKDRDLDRLMELIQMLRGSGKGHEQE